MTSMRGLHALLLLLTLLRTVSTADTACDAAFCNNRGHASVNATTNECVCVCDAGYSSARCERSPCEAETCSENGYATADPVTGVCACSCFSGHVGQHCELDTCTFEFCDYHGYPYEPAGDECKCACFPGYSGPQCKISNRRLAGPNTTCDPALCNHRGNATYNATIGNCTCACAAGFAGTWCQNSTCTYSTCNNNGFPNLNPVTGRCTCACYAGYSGSHCQSRICTYASCNYNGFPSTLGGVCSCSCFVGYTGAYCQSTTAPASSYPASLPATSTPAPAPPGLPTCELALDWPSYSAECTQCVTFANTSQYQQIVRNGVVQCPAQPQQALCTSTPAAPHSHSSLLIPLILSLVVNLLLVVLAIVVACSRRRSPSSSPPSSSVKPPSKNNLNDVEHGISLGKEDDDVVDGEMVFDDDKPVEEVGYNVCGGQPSRTYNVRDPNGGFSHNPYTTKPAPPAQPSKRKPQQPCVECFCHAAKPKDWASLHQHLAGPGHSALDEAVVLQCRECNWAMVAPSACIAQILEDGHPSVSGASPCTGINFAFWPREVLYVPRALAPSAPGMASANEAQA